MFPLLFVSLIFLTVVFLITRTTSSLTIPRYKTNKGDIAEDESKDENGDLPTQLGGSQTDEAPASNEQRVTAQYLMSYPKRVYFNQLFWLRVEIGANGVPLSSDPKRTVTTKGFLQFTHSWFPGLFEDGDSMPQPKLRVELKFNEDEFRVANNVQVKSLPTTDRVVYDFAVKSLKSEDSVLAVEIAYIGSKWQPQQVTEIRITENSGDESTTKTITPAAFVENTNVLVREELSIETKSFLNMNTASLNIFNKTLAAIVTVIYIGLVIGFGLTDDVLSTTVVGVSSLASALGIPVATGLWKDAQVKREKAVVS